jgi:hypothetical protein
VLGWAHVEPDDVAHLVDEERVPSDDSLNVSTGWGFKPKTHQIRLIADWDIPVVLVIDRVDQ